MGSIVETGQKTDLHIHSVYSKHKDGAKVNKNTIENIDTLVKKLADNRVNICSITDHDCFNYSLYKKLKGKSCIQLQNIWAKMIMRIGVGIYSIRHIQHGIDIEALM